jgi:hypothetical protein
MNPNLKRIPLAVGALAIALAVFGVLPASAQKVGTYSGSSKDGNPITIEVAKSSGKFTITNMNVQMTATCSVTGRTVGEGYGFGVDKLFSGPTTSFTLNGFDTFITGTLTFHANNTVTGKVESNLAAFLPGSTPPTQAQVCKSPSQTLSAALQ